MTPAPRLRDSLRAPALLARTLYLELARARYSRIELLQFVNALMGHMTDARASERLEAGSGLMDGPGMLAALDAALSTRREPVVIGCIDGVEPREAARVERLLQRKLRGRDRIGCMGGGRYVIWPAGADEAALASIATRFARDELHVRIRAATSETTGAELVAACAPA